MKESISCATHQAISGSAGIVNEGLHPVTLYPTVRMNTGERDGHMDPNITIEGHGEDHLKALFKDPDFLRDGFSYQRWIDGEGEVRHWHINVRPNVDDDTYKLLRSIKNQYPQEDQGEFVEHVNNWLPVFQIMMGEGITYDLRDGRHVIGQMDCVYWLHTKGGRAIAATTTDYKGKSIQTVLRPEPYIPRESGIDPDDVEVLAGIRFPNIDLFHVERALHERLQQGPIHEDMVRGIINPYFCIEK